MPFQSKYTTIYPALEPSNFTKSISGTSVIITGAGSGIGAATAASFAEAGAAQVHVLGRTQATLQETCTTLASKFPKTKFTPVVVDVSSSRDVETFFASLPSPADTLINNAGYLHHPGNFVELDVEDYWKSFEVNVLGVIRMTQAFLRHRRAHSSLSKRPGVVVTLSTGGALGRRVPRLTGNMAAKAGVARLMEEIAVDVPETEARFINVAPGVVRTAMHARSGLGDFLPANDVSLAAGVIVFAAADEAMFLNGRLIYATWDMEDLLARRSEIVENDLLRTGLIGLS